MPLHILGKSLDHLGDFPYKDPAEVRFLKPALFVRGTKSKYVPDEVIPLIGQFFPMFELVDIEAGHWVISENPEAFRQGERDPLCLPHLRSMFAYWLDGSCGSIPGTQGVVAGAINPCDDVLGRVYMDVCTALFL